MYGTDQYGSVGHAFHKPNMKRSGLYKGKRINALAIILALFVPWLMFCAVYAVRSLSIRMEHPWLASLVLMGAIFFTFLTFCLAAVSLHRKMNGDPQYQPMWYIFLSITLLSALIASFYLGEWNWRTNTQGVLEMAHLNEYSGIDPNSMRGQQIMDVGVVNFVGNTSVNPKLALGFRNEDIYCVAPIVTSGKSLSNYDFWAVGTNCCSGSAGSFSCGDYDNPNARSGLRLMSDTHRAFYRLAVQQAEAMFQISSDHPLFFHWSADAAATKQNMLSAGLKFFTLGCIGHFFLQLFLVLLAVMFFGKIGAY